MSDYHTAADESTAHDHDLDARDARALTEYMTVLDDLGRARDADGLYVVVSQSGSEYLVDADTGACECPDAEYRDMRCKHVRRVAFATGARPIPTWTDRDALDDQLGAHVDAEPRVVATDGGQLLEGDGGDDGDGDRPAECSCLSDTGLPCWPCYRDGFDAVNPDRPTSREVAGVDDGE